MGGAGVAEAVGVVINIVGTYVINKELEKRRDELRRQYINKLEVKVHNELLSSYVEKRNNSLFLNYFFVKRVRNALLMVSVFFLLKGLYNFFNDLNNTTNERNKAKK